MKSDKFNKLYKMIMEDITNPKLKRLGEYDTQNDSWNQKDDEWDVHDGACGSVIRINKTYQAWLDENVKKSYKKYDFDKNQTYEPVLTDLDGLKTKSYTGAELEEIKNEYKGSIRHNLELSMYNFSEDQKQIYDNEYEFKDIVTIDEENFYLDKNKTEKSGFTERKAFYVVISEDLEEDRRPISMKDLEGHEWLVKRTSTVEYYTQKDVDPYFDASKGKGRIFASVTIKPGNEDKLEEIKNKMIEMATEIQTKASQEKIERIKKSPAKIKQYNATRTRWVQEKTNQIQELQKEIERLQKEIERINSEMIK